VKEKCGRGDVFGNRVQRAGMPPPWYSTAWVAQPKNHHWHVRVRVRVDIDGSLATGFNVLFVGVVGGWIAIGHMPPPPS
jgi:hypothetical protein